MPLAKDYYPYQEALDLIAKVLPDEDPKQNLLEALRDGQVTAWYVDEAPGKVVDISSEDWRTVNRIERGKSHLVFDARTGYARLSDLATSLSRQRGGALRINKAALDALRAKTSSAVSSTTEHGRGRRPASSSNSLAVHTKFDEIKVFTFERGEFARLARDIADQTKLLPNTVEKMIRPMYKLKKEQAGN